MFTSANFTQDMLSNPAKLSKAVIDAMEASDTSGELVISDPNNGFVMQMFANMSVFSKFSEKIDHVTSFMYPQRARNAEQLYPHLSEFDYVRLMASPANLPFVFAVSKDWIISQGVYYDSNYNKLEIPATSFITMGDVVYSMYHPIEILINRNTGAVTAFYNTEKGNSLNTLASNMLLDVREYHQDGINWFQIQFNMYQFERKVTTYTAGAEEGFIRTLPYEDQFYAVKIFSKNLAGQDIELAYSLAQLYYDFKKPTALLTLLNDANQLKIEIPQIYFDNRQISQTIRVEMYTTKGKVNYSLSLADVAGLKANFDTADSVYSTAFDQMPSWKLVPTRIEVEGGSDVMAYADIREAIVNQRLYDRVAVTFPEIVQAGKRAGFDNLTRIQDDLTERLYFATNVLTDSAGMVIPTFAGNILIAEDALQGNPSTIINYTDGYYTILPTTTFTIAPNGLTCVPMTDGQVDAMKQMTDEQMVAELNKGVYVRQPFHITLLTQAKSPKAQIYNLLAPSMTSLVFVGENAHSAPQMSATACKVEHLGNGTGGYRITLGMTRSSNIRDAEIANFKVLLTCTANTGEMVYLPAIYNSTNADGLDLWTVQLATSYHITNDDHITVMMYDVNDTLGAVDIPLSQTFNILTTFVRSFDISVPIDSLMNSYLPVGLLTSDVAMARQQLTLALGTNLSTQIYSGVTTNWGTDVYQVAEETLYYQTNAPIFQTDDKGTIVTRYNATTQTTDVVVIYPIGAVPSDTQDLSLSTTTPQGIPSGATTTFTVGDTTGILLGMPARGLNIPVDAVVTAKTATTVTISKKITAMVPAKTKIVFTNTPTLLKTTAAQSSAGRILTVASTANILVGQSVFGLDIPTGATVSNVVDQTHVELSVATNRAVDINTWVSFLNTTAYGVVRVQKGDVIPGPTGTPIVVKEAQNEYMIPAILFDGRLFASSGTIDQEIVTTISQRLQNYADQISTIDAGLTEASDVYYKPARTMGYANFGIGANKLVTMSLELGFSLKVYVDPSVYNSSPLLTTMESSIVSMINEGIQKPIISLSDLTTTITESLGSNVSAVEMNGISGQENLRLISLEDSGAKPSIENLLVVQADGSIVRKPNITVTFLPKPDTAEDLLV